MLSLIYITFRENCRFEYFIEPLLKSIDECQINIPIQIIIVDGYLFECSDKIARRQYFANMMGGIDYLHVSPKPTRWQGEYKITKYNHFAAANTRNTGAAYCKYDYIAFIDDLGIISKSWLPAVLEAMHRGEINCGAYTKVDGMLYENATYGGGIITNGRDHRLDIYNSDISRCPGGHLYGSSFCMPKSVYFSINGQNEMCDGVAGEDYDLGVRLERAGHKIYYNKRMFIHESDTPFGSDINRRCLRVDPLIDEITFNSLLHKYNITAGPNCRKDFSNFMLAYASTGPIVVNPDFSLSDYNNLLTHGVSEQSVFKKPDPEETHFFTNKSLLDACLGD